MTVPPENSNHPGQAGAVLSAEPVSGRGTGDLVYAGLKDRILSHDLNHGAPLREDEVAGWFAASRVPAREALRKLEQEGLVERLGRSYAVRRFSFGEVTVIYRQRAALEHLAVELALEKFAGAKDQAEAGLQGVHQVLEAQRNSLPGVTRAEFSRLDKAFHMAIAAISGEALLLRELDIILSRVQLIRTAEITRDSGAPGAYADHCRIYQALLRCDGRTAMSELDYHFNSTVRLHRIVRNSGTDQDAPHA